MKTNSLVLAKHLALAGAASLMCLSLPRTLLAQEPAQAPAVSIRLPEGEEYTSWEKPLQFTATYYVDQAHPAASDDNPGAREKPFRTINRAAQVLNPGQRVVIAAGTYAETVRPVRGGSGPSTMISYEAAPGAKVLITGAKEFKTPWVPSTRWIRRGKAEPKGNAEAAPAIWTTRMPRELFPQENPFRSLNMPQFMFHKLMEKQRMTSELGEPILQYSGMLFQNGNHLTQVTTYDQLLDAPEAGVFWVEADGLTLHVRPLGNQDPNQAAFEATVRSTCFSPDQENLGYIRLKGLTVEKAGNGFPLPELGMISTGCGHHWIIEDCTVRWANGIGIDIGRFSAQRVVPGELGFHILRRNVVSHCGVSGIRGMGRTTDGGFPNNLLEDNVFLHNAWQDVERIEENASIKLLLATRNVVRHNLILGTGHGAAIWMDTGNVDCRITGNVIANIHTRYGAIFYEATTRPNLIDQNIIWNTAGAGIYEHNCKGLTLCQNLIGMTKDRPAIDLRGYNSDRIGPKGGGGQHAIFNNVIVGSSEGKAIAAKGEPSQIDGNVVQGASATFDERQLELQWTLRGAAKARAVDAIITADFFGRPVSPGAWAGPFGPGGLPNGRATLWKLDAPLPAEP